MRAKGGFALLWCTEGRQTGVFNKVESQAFLGGMFARFQVRNPVLYQGKGMKHAIKGFTKCCPITIVKRRQNSLGNFCWESCTAHCTAHIYALHIYLQFSLLRFFFTLSALENNIDHHQVLQEIKTKSKPRFIAPKVCAPGGFMGNNSHLLRTYDCLLSHSMPLWPCCSTL